MTTIATFLGAVEDELLCKAHKEGVRIVWGTVYPVEQLSNTTHRALYIQQLVDKVKNTFSDGVNVDTEDPIAKNSPERELLVTLMHELSEAFHQLPGTQVGHNEVVLVTTSQRSPLMWLGLLIASMEGVTITLVWPRILISWC